MELDDPKRCCHYVEQQVIKFLHIQRLNRNRTELENAVKTGQGSFTPKAAPSPRKAPDKLAAPKAAPGPQKPKRPRSPKGGRGKGNKN
eukprot:8797341-Prorocentrum_lima.AAC.1